MVYRLAVEVYDKPSDPGAYCFWSMESTEGSTDYTSLSGEADEINTVYGDCYAYIQVHCPEHGWQTATWEECVACVAETEHELENLHYAMADELATAEFIAYSEWEGSDPWIPSHVEEEWERAAIAKWEANQASREGPMGCEGGAHV